MSISKSSCVKSAIMYCGARRVAHETNLLHARCMNSFLVFIQGGQ